MIDYNAVQKARANIADYVKPTPLVEVTEDIYLKMESNHDNVNAFKIRGAYNKIKSLGNIDEVVTAAVGSHGFAVGDICQHLGIRSTCYMPETAPKEKKDKMQKLVDTVQNSGSEFSETEKAAQAYARDLNLPFIHPYNDERVIAGQGTIGLEIVEDLEDVSTVYVPVGGGGLLSGIAIALKGKNPNIRIVGVQPYEMHAMKTSIEEGKITPVERADSMAEPLCVNLNPFAITYELVRKYSNDFITPREQDIKYSMQLIYEKTGQKVEGAGAISLAAALMDKNRKGKAVCIVSGGNISNERFQEEVLCTNYKNRAFHIF
jgi:threonine dehydratase